MRVASGIHLEKLFRPGPKQSPSAAASDRSSTVERPLKINSKESGTSTLNRFRACFAQRASAASAPVVPAYRDVAEFAREAANELIMADGRVDAHSAGKLQRRLADYELPPSHREHVESILERLAVGGELAAVLSDIWTGDRKLKDWTASLVRRALDLPADHKLDLLDVRKAVLTMLMSERSDDSAKSHSELARELAATLLDQRVKTFFLPLSVDLSPKGVPLTDCTRLAEHLCHAFEELKEELRAASADEAEGMTIRVTHGEHRIQLNAEAFNSVWREDVSPEEWVRRVKDEVSAHFSKRRTTPPLDDLLLNAGLQSKQLRKYVCRIAADEDGGYSLNSASEALRKCLRWVGGIGAKRIIEKLNKALPKPIKIIGEVSIGAAPMQEERCKLGLSYDPARDAIDMLSGNGETYERLGIPFVQGGWEFHPPSR